MIKKTLVLLIALALCHFFASAQGTINYSLSVSGTLFAHVYAPEPGNPILSKSGNTAGETPTGTQTYTGALLSGSNFRAELFGANGSGQSESALTSVAGSITTFRTGSAAGLIAASTLTVSQVPISGTGTFQLRVWDSSSGLYPNWATAIVAINSGIIPYYGTSPLFDIANLGDPIGIPANMINFRSFNMYGVPEPGTMALLLIGASAIVLSRRKR